MFIASNKGEQVGKVKDYCSAILSDRHVVLRSLYISFKTHLDS